MCSLSPLLSVLFFSVPRGPSATLFPNVELQIMLPLCLFLAKLEQVLYLIGRDDHFGTAGCCINEVIRF